MDAAPININHPLDKPFCDECMEAMRENLQQLLENENSLNISNNSAEESNHIDSAWKKPLRAFYTRAAADKGLYYTENIAAKTFRLSLKPATVRLPISKPRQSTTFRFRPSTRTATAGFPIRNILTTWSNLPAKQYVRHPAG